MLVGTMLAGKLGVQRPKTKYGTLRRLCEGQFVLTPFGSYDVLRYDDGIVCYIVLC